MPPRPRPCVLFHSHTRAEDGTHIIELSINGTRHAYHLTPVQADTTEYLCRRVSALKALAYAKSRARLVLRAT